MPYPGFWKRYAVVMVCLALGAAFPFAYRATGSVPLRRPFSQFPSAIGGWVAGADHPLGDDVRKILKVHDYVMRDYAREDGRQVRLYIGYYGSLDKGEEVHSPRVCMPAGGWLKLSEKSRTVQVPGEPAGAALKVVETVFEKYGHKEVFLFWYQVGGQTLTQELLIKLVLMKNALLHHRPDSAFIRITAEVRGDDVDGAVKTAYEFLQDSVPEIRRHLP